MSPLSTSAAALALVCAIAARALAGDYVYDCSVDAERQAFAGALADLKSNYTEFYRGLTTRQMESPSGGKLRCTLPQWCYNHNARVKLAPPSGGALIAGVQKVPDGPCASPWSPVCESAACKYATAPLAKGDESTRVDVVANAGKATVAGAAPSFEAFSGKKGDFPGLTFSSGGEAYKVQPGTGFVFKRGAKGYLDTGAALPSEVFAALCKSSGAPCSDLSHARCADLGLTPAKKPHYKDARGGLWLDESSGGDCHPK
jgi:hypothetical protein